MCSVQWAAMMAAQCDAAEHYLRLEAPRAAVHPSSLHQSQFRQGLPYLFSFTYVLAHAGNTKIFYLLLNVGMDIICVQDFVCVLCWLLLGPSVRSVLSGGNPGPCAGGGAEQAAATCPGRPAQVESVPRALGQQVHTLPWVPSWARPQTHLKLLWPLTGTLCHLNYLA